MTEQTAAVIETPAPTEDDAMGAVWDKLAADGIKEKSDGLQEEGQGREEVTAAEAEPEAEAEEAPAPEPEKIEAPTDLPASIREKWGDMPEAAREAVLSSHRELSRKMADLGRVSQVAKPVYDVIVQAAKEIPTLNNMTPQQIAGDVFKMAVIQGQMAKDPVGTLLQVAQQYGAIDGMRAALAGQQSDSPAVDMMREIRSLRAQLESIADPSAIDRRVEQTLTTRETDRIVQEYAAAKPHWGEVENIMPQMIAIVQQSGEKASAQDILDAAYDMAIHAIPTLRAKVQAAETPQPVAQDPARVQAQLKAKSVNAVSKPVAAKPLTEEQAMAAIWEKHRG